MSGRMLKLVGFIVSLLERDENAQVVLARADLDGRSGELGADLVKASCVDAFVGALDPKGTDRRVVGRLFGQI